MSDETTTTIFLTTTFTSTKTLTRTILDLTSSTPLTTGSQSGFRNTLTNGHGLPSLYPYVASLPLAVLFTILYFLITLHHGYLSLYLPTRPETINKHRYTIPLFVASFLSTLGYLIRSISIQQSNTSNLTLYTTSTALILISPILICMTLYLLLTRLITRCLPSPTLSTPTTSHATTITRPNLQKFLFFRPTLLSVNFITSDTFSFLTQSLGAVLASSANWKDPGLSRGIHILLSGLALQLATFALYLLVFHQFCTRVRNSATHGFNPCIMKVVVGTWVASAFILLRTVYRLVEFAMGYDNYPFNHEWCLYVFEAFPVWVALAVLCWWHPVKWIQERVLAQVSVNGRSAGSGKRSRGERIEIVMRAPAAVASKLVEGRSGHVRRRSRVGFAL